MTIEKFYKLSFSSDTKNIHLVERYIEDLCDYFNINNTYFGNILTAVTEAVENAITHGNGNNPQKKVHLKFDNNEKGFSIMVMDEGLGFDSEAVPDPTDPTADFSLTEGRGLFVIKSLADEVNFHKEGRCIEMVFKVASITKQMADDRINTLLGNTKKTSTK